MNRKRQKRKKIDQQLIGSNTETNSGQMTIDWTERISSLSWIIFLVSMILFPWPAVKVAAGFALLISLLCFRSTAPGNAWRRCSESGFLGSLVRPGNELFEMNKNFIDPNIIGVAANRAVYGLSIKLHGPLLQGKRFFL